ncbi:MAG: radical SAM protein [Bacteroidales bacterium]|nr:radical SAM protein [Bacteroidales bacterium]
MAGFLFDNIVFGPVYSRRLGVSLGINLLPNNSKYCNFNCIYCECGWTEIKKGEKIILPNREELTTRLTNKLKDLKGTVNEPDTITFAGNGEPTIHPDFPGIIDDTIKIRDKYAPKAQISVLSNASMLRKPKVVEALKKIELNIQKLDSGIENTFNLINQTAKGLSFDKIVDGLLAFEGKIIVQTLFLRGEYNGNYIDNTTPEEIDAWLKIVKKINPEYVMIYPIDRGTPAKNLQKIPEEQLNEIATQVEKEGIRTKVYY